MNRLKILKDCRPLVAAAVDAGWTLTHGGRHTKLTSPTGDYATPVPSNPTIIPAFRLRLRRHGVDV